MDCVAVEVNSALSDLLSKPVDCLILALHDEWREDPVLSQMPPQARSLIESLFKIEEASTKPLKITTVLSPVGFESKLLVLVGLGPKSNMPAHLWYRAAAAAMKMASSKPREVVRIAGFRGNPIQLRAAVAGSVTGCVGQDLFRKEKSLHEPTTIEWCDVESAIVEQGVCLGNAINLTRRLVNLPPNYIYPDSLAKEAQSMAQARGLSVEVWDETRLEQERCGALLGVGRGSAKPARLVVLKYQGADASQPATALVGKGVTFDSGGYSIKPNDGMLSMKCDMAGAATVVGILAAAADLKVKKNLIGVLGLVENLVSHNAFKLGDVLTARSGKTIEIHNTDAEGRLVLADCLDVAVQCRPARIVDFATLTGACVVGLGTEISGLMTNNEAWQNQIKKMADACGEFTWPLPMHSFFSEQIAGKVADIKNVGEGRYGGAITAAKFLEEFVQQVPWTHIDIAGPAFLDSAKPWCDGGGTGTLVRTFAELFLSE